MAPTPVPPGGDPASLAKGLKKAGLKIVEFATGGTCVKWCLGLGCVGMIIIAVILASLFYGFDIKAENSAEPPPEAQSRTGGRTVGGSGTTGPLTYPSASNSEETSLADCLDTWMKSHSVGSPLATKGGNFVTAAKRNNINPALMIAIGMQETSLGTTGIAPSTKNFYGLTSNSDPSGWETFNTWEASIDRMGSYLGTGYVHHPADPRTTIAGIGGIWAPVGAGNDPNGLNAHWVGGVTSYFESLVSHCPELGYAASVPGDTRSLAGSLLENGRVTLLSGPRFDMTAAANGNKALSGTMLGAMDQLSQSYSYRVTALTNGVHSANSYHYSGSAIDIDVVNGVEVADRPEAARQLMQQCLDLGAVEVYGPWNDPDGNHWHHVHCAWRK